MKKAILEFWARLTWPKRALALAIVFLLLVAGVAGAVQWFRVNRIIAQYEADKAAALKVIRDQTHVIETANEKIAANDKKLVELQVKLGAATESMEKLSDELEKARDAVRVADTANERARAVQRISSTNAQLCAELRSLGHPCD